MIALDIQQKAVDATRALLETEIGEGDRPATHLVCGCHSQLEEVRVRVANALFCLLLVFHPMKGGSASECHVHALFMRR